MQRRVSSAIKLEDRKNRASDCLLPPLCPRSRKVLSPDPALGSFMIVSIEACRVKVIMLGAFVVHAWHYSGRVYPVRCTQNVLSSMTWTTNAMRQRVARFQTRQEV